MWSEPGRAVPDRHGALGGPAALGGPSVFFVLITAALLAALARWARGLKARGEGSDAVARPEPSAGPRTDRPARPR